MKFQTPLFLLASLITYVSGEAADTRSHSRDFSPEFYNASRDFDIEDDSHVYKRNPTLPPGKDATKLHVWTRLDTRPSSYDDRGGATHEGLNQLMKDTGGRHVDVVVGNSNGYHEYGLMFSDPSWQSKPNGDGAAVESYTGVYSPAPGETFDYKGQLDGRKTFNSIGIAAADEIKGKTYNHATYNCRTFADDMVRRINPKN